MANIRHATKPNARQDREAKDDKHHLKFESSSELIDRGTPVKAASCDKLKINNTDATFASNTSRKKVSKFNKLTLELLRTSGPDFSGADLD